MAMDRYKIKKLPKKLKDSINSWKSTAETLSEPNLLRELKEGLENLRAGRVSRVRDNVKNV